MTRVIEAKGDSIDSAIQNALTTLGQERDNVSVEVVQKPKSGFFGFGREPAIVRVTYVLTPAKKAKDFLEGLLERFGVSAEIEIREDLQERNIHIELFGSNMGAVIGRRGDTLNAFQYLTSIVANKEEEERWRVILDTEGYRAKREASLTSLAEKTARRALKYRKPVALEPMNPQERRIIHSALQSVDGITTYSTGNEPNRRVIVAPTEVPSQGNGSQRAGPSKRTQGNKGNRGKGNNSRQMSRDSSSGEETEQQ